MIKMSVKKILSLVMALAMVLAIAAPAFAASAEVDVHDHTSTCETEETIQRVPTLPCCGAPKTEAYEIRWDETYGHAGKCAFGVAGCNDFHATKYHAQKCGACGTNLGVTYTESGYYCPTWKNYRY